MSTKPDYRENFSPEAYQVLNLAQEEARRLNHNYVGTEHQLLGLVRMPEGDLAHRALVSLGVEIGKVRSTVEFIIGRGDREIIGEVGLTPRAKTVIELAEDERRRLNHGKVLPCHLLLGLVREGQGIGAGVLESLGVNLENVRTKMLMMMVLQQPPEPQEKPKSKSLPSRVAVVGELADFLNNEENPLEKRRKVTRAVRVILDLAGY